MKRWPTVSCICITRNRRLFLRQAVSYYDRAQFNYRNFLMQQGWSQPPHPELIVVDGSDHALSPQPTCEEAWVPNVRYIHRSGDVMRAGLSHNIACEEAKGDIIVQWDDDDWQHPWRIVRQVETLLQAPGDAFAYTSRYYWYHLQQAKACKAKSWPGAEGSTGATFAYWKETWKKTPFEDIPTGEDVPFQRALQERGCPMLDSKEEDLILYVRHNQNGSVLTNYQWNEEDTLAARRMVGSDLDFYDGIGELLPVANWNHPNAPGSKVHVMNPLQQVWSRHHR